MNALLTLNAGSSTIKFALYPRGQGAPRLKGKIAGIGTVPRLEIDGEETVPVPADAAYGALFGKIFSAVDARFPGDVVEVVSHRVVHGGAVFKGPAIVDEAAREAIGRLAPLAPLHQGPALEGIDRAKAAFPQALQTASFDTSFHADQPDWATVYALPPEWRALGLRRYGFHGLSYDYLSGRIAERFGGAARRVVAAHLGSGASLCAMVDGRSVASTMGFSALGGVPMGTRPGDLDPGVMLHLFGEGLSREAIEDGLYRRSGLKGLSGISADMRDLLSSPEPAAALAVEYFAHEVAAAAAGMAVAAGGLDLLVFSGGVGENAAPVRAMICKRLGCLGITLDAAANEQDETNISTKNGKALAAVIRTDEEAILRRDGEALAAHPTL